MNFLDTIDKETYKLDEDKFIKEGTPKKRVIIGNTFSTNMRHCIGWNKRWNGKYTRTAMFTIDINGKVYQHFSPNYYSNFIDNSDINETSISIVLENEGWLMKDLANENRYINYIGYIYNRKDSVIEKRWRNQNYWAPYSQEQKESAYKLIKELCKEFEIPLKAIGHNTNFDTVEEYEGILYKSNFEKYYTDVSPAWDCEEMKTKIEEQI
jgi:hypothetical protein